MKKNLFLSLILMLSVGMWAQESSKPDTVRIFNDILIIDEVYNPNTWEQVGWMYSTHDEEELYIFIRTNQIEKFGTFSFENQTIDTVGYYNLVRFASSQDTVKNNFIKGEMTIAEIEDSIVLDGEFLADNGKVYLFHLTHLTKALNYDTDIPLNADFEYFQMSYYLNNGIINIEANNIGYTLNLELYTSPDSTKIPAGTYTISDSHEEGTALLSVGVENFEPQYCYAATMDNVAGIMRDFWFITEGSVTLYYDEYGKLNVTVDAKNSYNQEGHLNVKYNYVEPKDTITFDENVDFEISKYIFKEGIYAAQAYLDAYMITLFMIKTDTMSGDFTASMDLPGCTFRSPETGYTYDVRDIDRFVITEEGKNLFLEASLLAGDSIYYIIKGTGYKGAILGDCKTSDFDAVFEYANVALSLLEGDTCLLTGGGEDQNIFITLCPDFAADSTVLPGIYPVIKCLGWTEGGLLPSNASTPDAYWMIQSGDLTINADGSMSFEGLNSYDRTVKFTVTAKGTDLETVDGGQCTMHNGKYIHKGQLLIRKNGKTYNAVGMEL